jgi:hypothetical protein
MRTGVALDAATLAKRAYADLWRAHRTRAVAERDLGLIERTARLVEQRYAITPSSAQADVIRAQVEVSHATGELQTAELAIEGSARHAARGHERTRRRAGRARRSAAPCAPRERRGPGRSRAP